MFNNCLILVVLLLLMIGYVYSKGKKVPKAKSGLSLIHVEISPSNEKLVLILAFLFILFTWYSSQPKKVNQTNTSSSSSSSSSSYFGMNDGGSSYSGITGSSFTDTSNTKKSEPKQFNIVSGLDGLFDVDSEFAQNISKTVADFPTRIEEGIKRVIPKEGSIIDVKVT